MAVTDYLEWDVQKLSDAMKIAPKDVIEYFTDGRRVSFILERRLAHEIVHGKLAPSEGEEYDLTDTKGGKWEVRSVTKGGVYFCPSNMVGKGRTFEKAGFLRKLNEIQGYILTDVVAFPKIPFWTIPKETVRKWWDEGSLGINSHVTHKKALELINSTIKARGLHSFEKK
jgi:hypothetical protein